MLLPYLSVCTTHKTKYLVRTKRPIYTTQYLIICVCNDITICSLFLPCLTGNARAKALVYHIYPYWLIIYRSFILCLCYLASDKSHRINLESIS